jgi:hypothetical protein
LTVKQTVNIRTSVDTHFGTINHAEDDLRKVKYFVELINNNNWEDVEKTKINTILIKINKVD